jgi:hypothetical protein
MRARFDPATDIVVRAEARNQELMARMEARNAANVAAIEAATEAVLAKLMEPYTKALGQVIAQALSPYVEVAERVIAAVLVPYTQAAERVVADATEQFAIGIARLLAAQVAQPRSAPVPAPISAEDRAAIVAVLMWLWRQADAMSPARRGAMLSLIATCLVFLENPTLGGLGTVGAAGYAVKVAK